MSKEINNRQYRANVIKELLAQLHAGKSVDDVKKQFAEAFDGVSAAEISEAEQALIAEGLPVAEVQRLCDVHAAVVGGSIEQIHVSVDDAQRPGHPAHTLKAENRAIERLIESRVRPHLAGLERGEAVRAAELEEDIKALYEIDKHYSKKENLIFPYMEKHGITAPPKVMWGVDDEIRAMMKQVLTLASGGNRDGTLKEKLAETIQKIDDMIYKEENILLPMVFEVFTAQEWQSIADESGEIGYCLIPEPPAWKPEGAEQTPAARPAVSGAITLPTGVLWPGELVRLLDTLPVDITFVGSDDTVRYFSQGAERVFPRTKAIIGRKVTDCHPPASVHIVEGIIADFKSGKKTHEDFWIKMGAKYVLIRYFAVRSESGVYLGTLEVTQEIAPIQQLSGEKRLVT